MTLLVAWLWQSLALIAVAALVLRALPRVSAATRHAVWWVALLAVVLLPVVATTGPLPRAVPEPADPEQTAAWDASWKAVALPSLPDWAVTALLGGWAASALLALVRLGAGIAAMERLKAASRPVPASVQARLRSWISWRARGRRVELRVSDHHPGACALGLRSPVILVSSALAEVLDAEELDAIVVHEYAHLARRDDWTRLAQGVIQAVVGLHPAVRLIARRIEIEREAACDDWVVTHAMPDAWRYAACLTELSAQMATRTVPAVHAVVPGAVGSRGSLVTRVSRLVSADLDRGRRFSRRALALAILGATGVLWLATTLHPVMVFAHTADAVEAAREEPVTPGPVRAQAPAAVETSVARPIPTIARSTPRPIGVTSPVQRLAPTVPRRASGIAPPAPGGNRSTLASQPFSNALHLAPDVPASRVPSTAADDMSRRTAWARVGGAGRALGSGAARAGSSIAGAANKAGLSLGGFFGRAGKAARNQF